MVKLEATIEQILEAAPDLHWRQCWECGDVGLHVDSMSPWVACRKCGSMDTRRTRRYGKRVAE